MDELEELLTATEHYGYLAAIHDHYYNLSYNYAATHPAARGQYTRGNKRADDAYDKAAEELATAVAELNAARWRYDAAVRSAGQPVTM